MEFPAPVGATVQSGGTLFRVFAPSQADLAVVIEPGEIYPMVKDEAGYHEVFAPGVGEGNLYWIEGNGTRYPDPASRYQPRGVHGPSQIIDPNNYAWEDQEWTGLERESLVFYELHVGTFSTAGTFRGVQEKLPYLRELGINAVELMPLADFPGRWNWGYDPAALFAPARAYGTPDDLRELIDIAHQLGLAVFIDVIYNHFGPDGAYTLALAPEFLSARHQTPWGPAINLDGEHSRGVRDFFIANARYWLEEFHADGLRLDATHALQDDSEVHFLAELAEAIEDMAPQRYLVAEDARNLNRIVIPRAQNGYGIDAVWADDFHHLMRRIVAGDQEGYYQDYSASTKDLAATLNQGWFFTGQFSHFLQQNRGTDPTGVKLSRLVFCLQNHDQVGNRPAGDRITAQIGLPAFRAASAILLFAPELPLLFMGQEWANPSPFQFFTDHGPEIGPLVSQGRREELKDFAGFSGQVPDPQDPATFWASKLDWSAQNESGHAELWEFYQELLRFRPLLRGEFLAASPSQGALTLRRGTHLLAVALQDKVEFSIPEAKLILSSEESRFSPDPVPPQIGTGSVSFARPGAALFEVLE